MDDDSPTPLDDSTKDQHSSDFTIQDYASASEENTMELFTEPQTSHPAGNGCKPAKILDVFTPFRKPPVPTLVTSKPVNTLPTQMNLALSLKNRTLVARISIRIVRKRLDLFDLFSLF